MDFETPTLELFTKGLSHADERIRNECLNYIKTSPSLSIAHSREILSQLALHGTDFYEYPHQVNSFPHDRSTIEQLFEVCLQAARDGDEDETGARYLTWCINVEPEQLPEVLKKLDTTGLPDSENLPISKLRSRAKEALRISQLSEADTLDELDRVLNEQLQTEYFRHDLVKQSKQLCQQLTRVMPRDRVEALARKWLHLNEKYTEPQIKDWQIGSGIYLSGLLKLEDETTRLLELFDEDWDLWNEDIQNAFIAMDSTRALELIHDKWFELPDHGQLYLSSVYEQLTPNDFEDFYHDIIKESDAGIFIKNSFARTLAHTGEQEHLDALHTYISRFPPMEPEALGLAETLYAHYTLRAYQPELAAEIRQRLINRDNYQLNRELAMAELLTPSLPVSKEAKVGRNDPCPCGSGKKYKKCCL